MATAGVFIKVVKLGEKSINKVGETWGKKESPTF